MPRVGVTALAAVLLACLNAPSTGGPVPPQPSKHVPRLASPVIAATGVVPLPVEQLVSRVPALAEAAGLSSPRPGRLLALGPRPVNPYSRPASPAELHAGRVAFAQLLEPTQPYVQVSGVAIRLGFDQRVDRAAVTRSFRIQPAVGGRLEWQDERTLRFTPEQLAYDTTYTVTVAATSASDAVISDWEWTFVTVKPVTLTIDDCASTPGELRNVLAVLAAKHLHAIMFPTGICNATYPWLVPQMLAEGHAVCNHTYSHPHLTKLSDAQIAAEIRGGVHAGCNLFRPPYGDVDGRVVQIAASLGYKTLLWDVDTLDWAGASAADILARIRGRGGVILLHFHGRNTVEAIRQL